MAPSDAKDEPWEQAVAMAHALSQERTRRESRRRRMALLWKVPAMVLAAVALGVAASLAGVPERVMSLLVPAVGWAFATASGAYIALGGPMPQWEYDDEPIPVRRMWVGAAVGFVVGGLVFFAVVRGH